MLGAHGDLHQKMYQAYDETTRVPLIVWSKKRFKKPRKIETVTSHIDLAPTLLGLAGIDPEPIRKQLVRDHSDARPMVGRDLSSLILGEVDPSSVTEPVYFMIEDDPYKGPHMGDAQGIAKPLITDPKCIETVIARLADGKLWKYSRYFDNPQYWSSPSTPEDVLLKQKKETPPPPYDGPIVCDIAVKGAPPAEEYELYDLVNDPMELINECNNPARLAQREEMERLLAEQRAQKRLTPMSGVVPGQPVF
jgi:choline-sulfatase